MTRPHCLTQLNTIDVEGALAHARTRTVIYEYPTCAFDDPDGEGQLDALVAVFEDGTALVVVSEYEGPLSEVTPGRGISPPSFYLAVTPQRAGDNKPAPRQ